MLLGQKELTIDDKARLMLPSIYRNGFEGGLCYASMGLDSCIELFPVNVYEKRAQKIIDLDDFDPKARDVKRTFLSNTFSLEIDSHNRILLPKALADKTGITKRVMVIGLFDHLEIWDMDKYQDKSRSSEENYSSDAKSLIGR